MANLATGDKSSNAKWSDKSGLIFSPKIDVILAFKSDAQSDLALDRDWSRGGFKPKRKIPLHEDGTIDRKKIKESAKKYGGTAMYSVSDLYTHILKQYERAKSSETTYKTKNGKIKSNVDRVYLEKWGYLFENEVLVAPELEDVIGVYLNTSNGKSISQALAIHSALKNAGKTELMFFTYSPKLGSLEALNENEVIKKYAEDIAMENLRKLLSHASSITKNKNTTNVQFSYTFSPSSFESFLLFLKGKKIVAEKNGNTVQINLLPLEAEVLLHKDLELSVQSQFELSSIINGYPTIYFDSTSNELFISGFNTNGSYYLDLFRATPLEAKIMNHGDFIRIKATANEVKASLYKKLDSRKFEFVSLISAALGLDKDLIRIVADKTTIVIPGTWEDESITNLIQDLRIVDGENSIISSTQVGPTIELSIKKDRFLVDSLYESWLKMLKSRSKLNLL